MLVTEEGTVMTCPFPLHRPVAAAAVFGCLLLLACLRALREGMHENACFVMHF